MAGKRGEHLRTVYAYRVEGEPYPSRWNPFRVACTADPEHSDEPVSYLVKVRSGRDGAAALISEVVAHRLAQGMGFRVHDVALVTASPAFAEAVNGMNGYPHTRAGLHFGTVWLWDVAPGAERNILEHGRPEEVIRLWVFDSWLANHDRLTEGNVLFLAEDGDWIMIPSDHSDCLGGAGLLTRAGLLVLGEKQEPVRFCPQLERHLATDEGCAMIEDAIGRARSALGQLDAVLHDVPAEWWAQADLGPEDVRGCLNRRAGRLEAISRLSHWKGASDAIRGGRQISLNL